MSSELNAIRDLKTGVLLLLLVPLLLFIVFVTALGVSASIGAVGSVTVVNNMAPGLIQHRVVYYTLGHPLAALAVLLAMVVLLAVSLVLVLVSLSRLSRGFAALSAMGKGGYVGRTGVLLVLVGILIAVVGVAAVALPLVGAILMGLGAILAVVGFILVGVGLFEVGSAYRSGTTEVGGILTAIAVIPLISFVGLIVSYVGLGEVERQVSSQQAQG